MQKGSVYEVAVYCTIKNTKRVFRIYPKEVLEKDEMVKGNKCS